MRADDKIFSKLFDNLENSFTGYFFLKVFIQHHYLFGAVSELVAQG